jgi:molybdenum-dependent DNA-binding transcriptional regulator ModE
MKDQIVDEVRQTRLKIEQACETAGISYKDHLLAIQNQYASRLVKPPVFDAERKGEYRVRAVREFLE